MHLKPYTVLQGGKYRIIRVLGQGGFGITYEAEQVLLCRKVAIKEFFMKDCCERDGDICHVTVGTGSQSNLVKKFRRKFIREAQMIAGMEHPNIIRVTDVFEENGTAYYVMDYLPGGSLADKVKKDGPLTEAKAEQYIRQVADALSYIHSRNTVHLDVKPSNILLNAKDETVLIDFGISKHYDDSGEQTSSTPIGISKGYAPLEQGRDGDVSLFKPSTDIYALGATLYYLVSGLIPQEASIVNEDGLERLEGISGRIWEAIELAMQPKRRDRPQSISAFLSLLDAIPPKRTELDYDNENTVLIEPKGDLTHDSSIEAANNQSLSLPKDDSSLKKGTWLWGLLVGFAVVIMAVVTICIHNKRISSNDFDPSIMADSTIVPSPKPINEEALSNLEINNNSGRASSSTNLQNEQTQVKPEPSRGAINGHEWVDLGLSVKWATCNVGASSPEENGYYYAWGETSHKNEYSWENYKFWVSGNNYDEMIFSKYNTESDHGNVDYKRRLDRIDDAARVNWGGNWRMPTKAEQDELRTKCIWTWTTQNGKEGYKVTSKSNGNSIFLPIAGSRGDANTRAGNKSYGDYWSATLCNGYSDIAYDLVIDPDGVFWSRGERFLGYSVRPVF